MTKDQIADLKSAKTYLENAYYELDEIYGLTNEKQMIVNELAIDVEVILEKINELGVV